MWILKKKYDYWWTKYGLEKTSLFDRNLTISLKPRRRSHPLRLVWWALKPKPYLLQYRPPAFCPDQQVLNLSSQCWLYCMLHLLKWKKKRWNYTILWNKNEILKDVSAVLYFFGNNRTKSNTQYLHWSCLPYVTKTCLKVLSDMTFSTVLSL